VDVGVSAKEHEAKVIACSALLMTTMTEMKVMVGDICGADRRI
jgi:methanogenic corrinoid protein MtbC1